MSSVSKARRIVAVLAIVAGCLTASCLALLGGGPVATKALAYVTRHVRVPFPMRPAVQGRLALEEALPVTPAVLARGSLNARDYVTSFRPYAAASIWNRKVSSHPTYLANSAAIVAAEFPGGRNPDGMRGSEAGFYDYGHPLYFATASDPVVKLACKQYCGRYPSTMHIPAKARPAGGTDAHIAVVQPDGTEIDAWAVYGSPGSNTTWNAPHDVQVRDWQTGDTLTAGNISVCGNFTAGSGLVSPPGATAANFCLRAGIVTAAELISGHIDHALFVGAQCAIGNQYPSTGSTQQCTSGLGPPLGGRVWYDVPCASTRADEALHPWEKAILCALNEYGGYFGDNGNGGPNYTGGIAPMLESEEPWRAWNGNAYRSPFEPLGSQGWSVISVPNAVGSRPGNRWVYDDQRPWNPRGVNFGSHIHWLAECSARGGC